MYLHTEQLINEIAVDEPDPAAANALQEGLGGQFGEMRTMMQYLFQSINFRGDANSKPYKDLLQGVGTDMVICYHKTIRRHERAAASGVEANTRFLQMLQPVLRRLELILLFELLERWRIEKPHSFIGGGRYHEGNYAHNGQWS